MRSLVHRLLGGLAALLRRDRTDRDLDDELRAFLEDAVEDKMQRGASREAALRTARAELGSAAAVRDHVRDAGWETAVEHFLRDVRYAWRSLWRSRAFAATTVFTLATGLGLITVLFTVFNAYVLRPFAVREPHGLYALAWRSQEAAGSAFRWSDYEDVLARTDLFDGVVADTARYVASGGSTLSAAFVSGNYFDTLAPAISLGRGLASYDAAAPGSGPVAVLSDRAWERLFDRDPGALGRTIALNGQKLTIVGIARPEFQGIDDAPQDIWVPVTMLRDVARQDVFGPAQPRELRIVVRLRHGLAPAQAEAALGLEPFETRLAGRVDSVRAELLPQATPVRLTLELAAVLAPVFAAFGLVLAAASANASNVMLARANMRHREIGIRLALGAGRGRVVRQLLTEGLLLAVLAGAAGLGLAAAIIRAGTGLFLASIPGGIAGLVRIAPLDFDHRVFLFAFSAAGGVTILFALVPALHATRLTLTDAVRGQAGRAVRSSTLRGFLIGAQVAISLALLIVAATLARNESAIASADIGFDPDGIVSVNQRGDTADISRVQRALAADPRVGDVVVTSRNPLFGMLPKSPVRLHGEVLPVSYMHVTPGYFSMLKIPLLHGRNFSAAEARQEAGVAVVSAAAARRLWPDDDPIGKPLRLQIDPPHLRVAETVRTMRDVRESAPGWLTVTVIGVAKDVTSGLIYEGTDPAHVYLPTSPDGAHAGAILLHGRQGVDLGPEAVRAILQQVDPDPLLFETIPLPQMLAVQTFPLYAASWIGSLLGAVALVLSVSGLYGVLSYLLGQRRGEIAVRMALGATAASVIALVMRQSARLAGIGAAVGLLFAFVVMKLLSGFVHLENVSVLDPGAFAIGLLLVAAAVGLASWGPARHAARIDPAVTLKKDA